jgi:TP901 family phage tail tape measure protein
MIAVGARAAGRAVVTGLAGYATVSAAKSLVTNFAGVERRLNRIAINAGKGKEEVGKMLDVINRASHDYAMSQDDVTAGFESLIAAGQDYKDAMDFLPSVTATAQASGAAVDDIAKSAFTLATNFGIAAPQMQKAFDILDTSGKQGMFELKDMAQYLPSLTPAMAALGYKGTEGLKKLVALLQTIRLQTGDASSAATNLQNVLQKMETSATATAFKKMGVDLRSELAKARKEGKDLLDVFVQLTLKATKGDLSKLPQLFTDVQFQQGMRAIIQGSKALKEFYAGVDDDKVTGAVLKDLNQILGDSQTKVDRLSSSWTNFTRSLGEGLVNIGVTDMLGAISDKLDYNSAVNAGLERSGAAHGFIARSFWGMTHSQADKDAMARSAGYIKPGDEEVAKAAPNAYRMLGRFAQRPHSRVTSDMIEHYETVNIPAPPAGGALAGAERRLGLAGPVVSDFTAGAERAKDSLAEGGKNAGQAVEDGGKKAGSALESAARAIMQAANYLSRAGAAEGGIAPSPTRVNADVGRSGGDLVGAP